jgi:hypothetical protein
VYGVDVQLFTPSPPGWLDDRELDQQIAEVLHLASPAMKKGLENGTRKTGEVLEHIFNNIGNVTDRDDRAKVARLFASKGGTTPSYHVMASRLFELMISGTSVLCDEVVRNPNRVELGSPALTTEDMHLRWVAENKRDGGGEGT